MPLLPKTIDDAASFFSKYDLDVLDGARLQQAVWNGEDMDEMPLLCACPMDTPLPSYSLKEAYFNSEKMYANGLNAAVAACMGGGAAVPSIRANMGCGVFPGILGVKPLLFDDKMPWVKEHIPKEQLMKLDAGALALSDDFKLGLEHMHYMAGKVAGTCCRIYPMDLQGALDTAHIVYGDQLFYDLYDDAPFVHHLLELCCEAIRIGMDACIGAIPGAENNIAHYCDVIMPRALGGIKLSEDTSTLLSPEHIDEFVAPYIKRILTCFGGGYVHYCGKNDYLFETVKNIQLVRGVNFGNPEKHDMTEALKALSAAGKTYYGDVPKKDGEKTMNYFIRCLKASYDKNAGCSRLLLKYRTGFIMRDADIYDWRQAYSLVKGLADTE